MLRKGHLFCCATVTCPKSLVHFCELFHNLASATNTCTLHLQFYRSCKEEEEEKQEQVRAHSIPQNKEKIISLVLFLRVMLRFFICKCRKKKEPPQQTDPPSIPVTELFPSGEFPEGEIQQYKDEYVHLKLLSVVMRTIQWLLI